MLVWLIGHLWGSQALLFLAGVATGVTIGVMGYHWIVSSK